MTGRFADGDSAWVWRTARQPSRAGAPPLALLAQDEVERVAEAA